MHIRLGCEGRPNRKACIKSVRSLAGSVHIVAMLEDRKRSRQISLDLAPEDIAAVLTSLARDIAAMTPPLPPRR